MILIWIGSMLNVITSPPSLKLPAGPGGFCCAGQGQGADAASAGRQGKKQGRMNGGGVRVCPSFPLLVLSRPHMHIIFLYYSHYTWRNQLAEQPPPSEYTSSLV